MSRRTVYLSSNKEKVLFDHARSDRRYITLTIIGTDIKGISINIPAGDVEELAKRLSLSVVDALPPRGKFEEEY
jgi:hypothetical protein